MKGPQSCTTVPLGNDQVKVGVEGVRDGDARVPISTEVVQLVGQTLNTFLAWTTHLVQHFSEKVFTFWCVYYYQKRINKDYH